MWTSRNCDLQTLRLWMWRWTERVILHINVFCFLKLPTLRLIQLKSTFNCIRAINSTLNACLLNLAIWGCLASSLCSLKSTYIPIWQWVSKCFVPGCNTKWRDGADNDSRVFGKWDAWPENLPSHGHLIPTNDKWNHFSGWCWGWRSPLLDGRGRGRWRNHGRLWGLNNLLLLSRPLWTRWSLHSLN